MTTSSVVSEETPLMKQYGELKVQAGSALLFFRMGDFYELFADDAVLASRLLEITLTSRDKGKANPMPMAGVPHHSAQGYIQRLLKLGHKVAIAEQLEEAPPVEGVKGPKQIVKREITRIFTPAVQFDPDGSESLFLATALPVIGSPQWVLVCLEPSTGEVRISDPSPAEELRQLLSEFSIRHFLRIGHQLPAECVELVNQNTQILVEDLPTHYLSHERAVTLLSQHYGFPHLEPILPTIESQTALGLLLHYTLRTQQLERLAHLQLPRACHETKSMALGPRTVQHLDLLPGTDGTPSLFNLLNRTKSSLGARQLKRWLAEPLREVSAIQTRQQAVRELSGQSTLASALATRLGEVYDLERILARVNTGLASPRDTLALGQSLAQVGGCLPHLSTLIEAEWQTKKSALHDLHQKLQPLTQQILTTLREDAPLTARDGQIFRRGTSPELDHLIDLTENGQRWLIEFEAREREATGISSLKVRYNRVFGYYIEITTAHLKNAPTHYQRKQTMVGAERFFTDELKKFEEDILTASSRQKSLEIELFQNLVRTIGAQSSEIQATAILVAEIDALQSLSQFGRELGWCFPTIDESLDIEIHGGRHPLVEAGKRGTFIPNDLHLGPNTRTTLLVTGPNMGGKSTVMRQAALILILGQMGAPVPADRARWGVVSSLYTRIGAHDAISRGQSTFMVEMSELAHILHHADDRSFIVLDEIGRGTSTYDGMSVAWATLEWICRQIGARTLFATHYHELTHLSAELPRLANAHMAVESSRGTSAAADTTELRFLYQLREGPTNDSFGIQVAKLAGLPRPVIDRAWQVLEKLESTRGTVDTAPDPGLQLSLFDTLAAVPPPPPKPDPLLATIGELNLNEMTPIQALNTLVRLQETARERGVAIA